MALVSYSDSEGSEDEAPVALKPAAKPAQTSTFQKTEPRKIKVALPALDAEAAGQEDAQPPPAKRARTAGAFGGFNSLLPAPKRPAAQPSGLKKGVSLKTSSEAAFSRVAPPSYDNNDNGGDDGEYDDFGNKVTETKPAPTVEKPSETASEVKIVGKATRFKPLSVSNNKKKTAKKVRPAAEVVPAAVDGDTPAASAKDIEVGVPPPAAKPKKSLFSVEQEDMPVEDPIAEPDEPPAASSLNNIIPAAYHTSATSAPANSLEAVAADLNLTPAQRRQLFGRHAKDVHITHFNMDNEYAANEQLRQSGEQVEHRAVKSIAPGKHSLQQLVNNARTNQEGIEDKWAEGRRNRGEGSSKYGWGGGK